ncbi:MAG: Uma2 family endonuclease [Verrucomicrobia bacterium]|nr:Uma2 family endonuclease [Verrucomicrobiota bacterium]
MVASLLLGPAPSPEFAELLRPERLPDGTDPEERFILCGVSWQRYLDLDKALGDDRSGPRFYYLDGDLELMTTSNEHERIKKWIAGLLEIYLDETGRDVVPGGRPRCVWRSSRRAPSRMSRGAWARRRNSPIWCWKLP